MIDFSKIKNWDDACKVEIPHGTKEACEGNEYETFLAGWVNAADMIDDKELDANDDEAVIAFVFADFDNMGHKR